MAQPGLQSTEQRMVSGSFWVIPASAACRRAGPNPGIAPKPGSVWPIEARRATLSSCNMKGSGRARFVAHLVPASRPVTCVANRRVSHARDAPDSLRSETHPMFSKTQPDDLAVFGGPPVFDTIRSISNLVQPDIERYLAYSKMFHEAGQYTDHGPSSASSSGASRSFIRSSTACRSPAASGGSCCR